MASRQFLKILQSARFGDVSAQQNLASAYLTGAFNTPIQPANSLVWLEKSYFSITNQLVTDISSDDLSDLSFSDSLAPIFSLLSTIPLANTVGSPAFPFGWKLFWKLAVALPTSPPADSPLSAPSSMSQAGLKARWQLIQCLLSPEYADEQARLRDWLVSADIAEMDFMPGADLLSLQLVCKSYLQSLAETESSFTQAAKELLLRLQPKDETLSGLWAQWLASGKQEHLLEAAEMGLTIARLTLGLQLAQLDGVSGSGSASDSAYAPIAPSTAASGTAEVDKGRSNASLKKAVYWLELAAKDGNRDAWFALGEIYRRPQFSGYNAAESDRCFDRAADLGHAEAQFRKGANLWRRREKLEERVKGLQASYWVWQAQQQGVQEASTLLSKILESCPHPTNNDWHELALLAEQAINRHAEYKIEYEWLLLCHRLVVANQFHLSKAELLLADIAQLQHEHCVVVDIRWELPKILPRLIQIETIGQRRALLAAGKVFTGNTNNALSATSGLRDSITLDAADEDELVESREREGNLRQRRYRFEKVSQWLLSTFAKEINVPSEKRLGSKKAN
jgi:TPR repeat protein